MKVLIDIGHPAHVHIFKNFAKWVLNGGGDVLFTCRDKEFETFLLKKYGFSYVNFGKKYKSIAGKLFGLIKFDLLETITALKFKPDIFLSAGSMYAAHAAFLLQKPHISFEDTFNMEQVRLYLPFTDFILVSSAGYPKNLPQKKLVVYDGYHELAYLHPNYFRPNEAILKNLGVKKDEKFILIRFVSWNATHDRGEKGIENKEELVIKLSKKNKVFISSEGALPKSLEKYRLKIDPSKIHDVMAYASLFIGEGATMASECAILGTPAIYINSLEAFTIKEQERFGLIFHYKSAKVNEIVQKADEILSTSKEEFTKRKKQLLKEKIDVTKFLINFVNQKLQKVDNKITLPLGAK